MTPVDPWERFLRDSTGAPSAGYFEGARQGATGRSAHWFSGSPTVVTLSPKSDDGATGRELGRFLRRHRRGAVLGYLGFDAVGLFEPALRRFPVGSPFPLGELALVPEIRTASAPRRPRQPLPRARVPRPRDDSLPRPAFRRAVRHLIAAIREGEAFQVVLGHRRSWTRPEDLLERAGRLRAGERFSSFFYLRFGDRELVGASPESVAEVEGRTAFIDPIAGTIPAGPRGGRRPLHSDPKELCEHRMLVDLARNDLGRVARPGSVRLDWTERLVRYARLAHLVSRVRGELPSHVDPWDVLGATFPAGTVCGAPKIRATELLRAEEASWRGPYGGTVALIRPGRCADFALAIRSAFADGRRLYTAAGAGIVHRSQPDREFDETLAKLSAIESALVGEPA